MSAFYSFDQVKISSGTSLSGKIDCRGREIVGVHLPSAWDAANITFAASEDDIATYDPVTDTAGGEVTWTAAASKFIQAKPGSDVLTGQAFVKLRSGTSGAAVNQTADRTVTVITRPA